MKLNFISIIKFLTICLTIFFAFNLNCSGDLETKRLDFLNFSINQCNKIIASKDPEKIKEYAQGVLAYLNLSLESQKEKSKSQVLLDLLKIDPSNNYQEFLVNYLNYLNSQKDHISKIIKVNADFEDKISRLNKDLEDQSDDKRRYEIDQELIELYKSNKMSQNKYGRYTLPSLSVPTYLRRDLLFCPSSCFLDKAELGEFFYFSNGRIIQVKVRNQTSIGGGGAATCGYQALLNGIIIARLILSSNMQRSLILYELEDSDLRMNLIGHNNSSWRSCVINKRIKNALKEFIFNFLLVSIFDEKSIDSRVVATRNEDTLPFSNGHKEFLKFTDLDLIDLNKLPKGDQYEQALKIFERNLFVYKTQSHKSSTTTGAVINEIVNNLLSNLSVNLYNNKIKISSKDFKDAIIASIKLNRNNIFNKLYRYINGDRNKILQIIDQVFPNLSYGNKELICVNNCFSVHNLPNSKQIEKYIKLDKSKLADIISGKPAWNPGEWLDGGEIQDIVDLEQNRGNLLNRFILYYLKNTKILPTELLEIIDSYCGLAVGEDIIYLGDRFEGLKFEQLEYNIPGLTMLKQFAQNPDNSGIKIIILLVGENHWITVVLNKRIKTKDDNPGDDIQYIVADSICSDYTQNAKIIELIKFIESRSDIPESAATGSDSSGCVIS